MFVFYVFVNGVPTPYTTSERGWVPHFLRVFTVSTWNGVYPMAFRTTIVVADFILAFDLSSGSGAMLYMSKCVFTVSCSVPILLDKHVATLYSDSSAAT